ncbi:asparagine synthase (glutamine-hydrolyzing) [Thermodesulfobacteriota bacterium]
MCGVSGFIIAREGPDPTKILKDMAAAIVHRGPDDEGFFESLSSNGQFRIGLAHRRLSIIDLESGRQPICNEDGSVQIVFNGEIYNFIELRKGLISRGHNFTTESDTETIVHAYEEYGLNCVDHLRGMFAFAIWDSNKEKLFLARDRFGKKPLFLYENNGNIFFASEIKAILTCPGVEPEVDNQAVWQYLAYRYVPGPESLFTHIRKLPPSTIAVWGKGNLTEHTYYKPPDQKCWVDTPLPIDPIKSFLEKLDESVKVRMISDVPYGAFLSGGIDSSAIVALMSRHSSRPVKTFSVGFKEQKYSELTHARIIAEKFNTDHHELILSQENLMDELEALVLYRDAPVAEPSDIPIYLLSKEARGTVKMVLTGEGSDEILGGYPKHIFEHFIYPYQFIPEVIRTRLFEPLVSSLPYRFRRAKTAIINLGLTSPKDRFPRWFGALSPNERKMFASIQPYINSEAQQYQFMTEPGNSSLRRILYFDQTSWLPDNLLERGDRMTMAASLEARMPFMDHELAEFVSTLPDRYRVRGLQTKWILREAMKELLPSSILGRAKIGFRVPVNEWFQGPMRDYLYDHLTGPNSVTKVYYHAKEINKTLDDHVNGRQNNEKLLWALLTLEIWHRLYKVKPHE